MTQEKVKAIGTLIAIGGALVWDAIRRHKLVRKIKDTPRSKIASAPQGLVELQGFAWPTDGGAIASNHGTESVYYSLKIEKKVTRGIGKNKRSYWETIYTKVQAPPFYIIDSTGLALITSPAAQWELEGGKKRNWWALKSEEKVRIKTIVSADAQGDLLPTFDGFLGLFYSQLRVTEQEIKVGSPVYVTGHFKSDNGQAAEIKLQGLTLFAQRVFNPQTGAEKNLLSLMDKNKNGKLSAQESILGYSFAASIARGKSKTENLEENIFKIYGTLTASEHHSLLVADAHETSLIERLSSYMIIRYFAGAALMSVAMSLLLDYEDIKKTKTSPIREVAAISDEIKSASAVILHKACISGEAISCQALLENQDQYLLTPAHTNYYSFQACKLGVQKYCNNPK